MQCASQETASFPRDMVEDRVTAKNKWHMCMVHRHISRLNDFDTHMCTLVFVLQCTCIVRGDIFGFRPMDLSSPLPPGDNDYFIFYRGIWSYYVYDRHVQSCRNTHKEGWTEESILFIRHFVIVKMPFVDGSRWIFFLDLCIRLLRKT